MADIDFVAFSPRGKSVEDMTRKEVIKTLRNKVPVEYVRDQYFEDAAELPSDLPRPVRMSPARDDSDRGEPADRSPGAGQKKARGSPAKTPATIRDHLEDVRGKNIARFLDGEMTVIRETSTDEMEKAVETLDTPVTGIVTDRAVDQKLLDRLVQKGVEYIAAKDFKGIIKRPLNIRLMKMGS